MPEESAAARHSESPKVQAFAPSSSEEPSPLDVPDFLAADLGPGDDSHDMDQSEWEADARPTYVVPPRVIPTRVPARAPRRAPIESRARNRIRGEVNDRYQRLSRRATKLRGRRLRAAAIAVMSGSALGGVGVYVLTSFHELTPGAAGALSTLGTLLCVVAVFSWNRVRAGELSAIERELGRIEALGLSGYVAGSPGSSPSARESARKASVHAFRPLELPSRPSTEQSLWEVRAALAGIMEAIGPPPGWPAPQPPRPHLSPDLRGNGGPKNG